MTVTSDFPELPELAHDGWGLATWLLIAAVAIVLGVAWLSQHGARRDLRAIKDQVKNGHTTPMRSDMDGMSDRLDDVLRDLRGVRQDIGGLRGELRSERAERLDFRQHVTDRLRDPK